MESLYNPSNLYEQCSATMLDAVASCLGFPVDTNSAHAVGFRIALREIPVLPDDFTVGSVVRAYCTYVLAQSKAAQS